MNMKEYCKQCRHFTEPAEKDPCRTCMDTGIHPVIGRPLNYASLNEEVSQTEQKIKLLQEELVQAIAVIKDYATRHGECVGCLHNYRDIICTHPKYKGICDNEKENHFEWRGLMKEAPD